MEDQQSGLGTEKVLLGDAKVVGDRPPAHPHSYPGGTPHPATALRAEGFMPLTLSAALSPEEIEPGHPYLLKDTSDRVVCVNKQARGSWDWAYVGKYDDYPLDVAPVVFSVSPFVKPATMKVRNDLDLRANGPATTYEYVFWGSAASYGHYPLLVLKATGFERGFTLSGEKQVDGKTVTMTLCADSGSYNWLYIGNSSKYTALSFSIHKFYVDRERILDALEAVWPGASFDFNSFRQSDAFYEVIDDAKAKQIWNASKLNGYEYKPEVFDCDDFAWVYKAQASRQAYADNASKSFAVAFIAGRTRNSAHAANLFVDYSGRLKVLEPQTGSIVAAADWTDNEGEKYQPIFVAL